jgi:hypothetical protein
MDNEQTPTPAPEEVESTEADGYYGEDEMNDEELDLSFLDEDDDSEMAKDDKPAR